MKRILIYWTKKATLDIIRRTKEKYNINEPLTVNHTTECVVDESVYSALQKAEELGYLEIRTCSEIPNN